MAAGEAGSRISCTRSFVLYWSQRSPWARQRSRRLAVGMSLLAVLWGRIWRCSCSVSTCRRRPFCWPRSLPSRRWVWPYLPAASHSRMCVFALFFRSTLRKQNESRISERKQRLLNTRTTGINHLYGLVGLQMRKHYTVRCWSVCWFWICLQISNWAITEDGVYLK